MKKLFFAVCLLTIILGVGVISASELAEHDFGNFTMDVPADASFSQVIPPGVNWSPSGNSVKADYDNTCWSDKDAGLVIEFCKGDFNKSMNARLSDAVAQGDEGELHIFDISGCKYSDGCSYAVCKNMGDSSVIVMGSDLDSLKEMAKTAKV